MPTFTLTCGLLLPMVQNQVYMLPPGRCTLFTTTVGATIQQSTDSTFATNAPVTITAAGQAEVLGGFIRCTSGTIGVIIRKF